MSRRWIVFLATGAYLGFAPIVPGTFGTLAGVAIYPLFDAVRWLSTPLYLGTYAALVVAAIGIADRAEVIFGEKDSGKITIDEVVGYLAATLFVTPRLSTIGASFVLFRIFDVWKPWPANFFDRQPGGRGVVLDDVCSGIYANAALRALFWMAGGHP